MVQSLGFGVLRFGFELQHSHVKPYNPPPPPTWLSVYRTCWTTSPMRAASVGDGQTPSVG